MPAGAATRDPGLTAGAGTEGVINSNDATTPSPKYPGEQFIATLMINVLVPFLMVLERERGRNPAGLSAGEIIAELRSEHNQIMKNWGIFGIRACNAMESQALLHLYQFYCKQKRCLECQIGAHVVLAPIHEKN